MELEEILPPDPQENNPVSDQRILELEPSQSVKPPPWKEEAEAVPTISKVVSGEVVPTPTRLLLESTKKVLVSTVKLSLTVRE